MEGNAKSQAIRAVGKEVVQAQNGVFFVPKFVCKFGDKKYPKKFGVTRKSGSVVSIHWPRMKTHCLVCEKMLRLEAELIGGVALLEILLRQTSR